MSGVGVGLLGCGVVGSAVVRGLAARPAGMVLRGVAVRDVDRPRDCSLDPRLLRRDAWEVVEDPAVAVVIEVIGGIEEARTLIERCLELGKPVVTANKAVLGAHGQRLRELASRRGVPLVYEAAVAGAVPVVRALSELRRVDHITKVSGVLNGTSTFVLAHARETGASLDEALSEARRRGYAEADATRDLDGTDAADKLAVLASYLFDVALCTGDVDRIGIDALTEASLRDTGDRRWQLVATAVRGRCARVEPVALRPSHPFASLRGAECAVTVTGARCGPITLTGAGAGGDPTAASILADLSAVCAASPRPHRLGGALESLDCHGGQPALQADAADQIRERLAARSG